MTPEERIELLHARLFELVETVAHNLYRHTLESLRKINPTLDELAELCATFIEILEAAGESKIIQMREAVRVIKEAAQAVGTGDLKTITDCAYHLDEVILNFKKS